MGNSPQWPVVVDPNTGISWRADWQYWWDGRAWRQRSEYTPPALQAPPPQRLSSLAVYLKSADTSFATEDGGKVVMEGFHPFFDHECTQPIFENDDACTTDHVFYCRLVGGMRHQQDLQNPVFDLGEQVLIVPERNNPVDPNALLVGARRGNSIFKAGYLPKTLAASLAPLIPVGEGGAGAVVQTVVKDGIRTGLRIVGSVMRDMMIESVPTTKVHSS